MDNLPLKETVKYPVQTGAKVSTETADGLNELKKQGVNIGALKREAISRAVREALQTLNKSA